MGVRRQARGEAVEEGLRGRGGDLGQHQREALAGGGADRAEQEGPLAADLAQVSTPP